MTPKLSTLFVTTILALAMSNAHASWFCKDKNEEKPSNYEECLLDVMKETERFMLPTAEKLCELRFPQENIDKEEPIKISEVREREAAAKAKAAAAGERLEREQTK